MDKRSFAHNKSFLSLGDNLKSHGNYDYLPDFYSTMININNRL